MDTVLKHKVVVVTGGANGIGCAIADSFLQEHVKVLILLDIDEATGAKSAEALNLKYGGGKAVFMKCDVTKDLDAVSDEIFMKFKRIDVLVNNAGMASENVPGNIIDLNVTSVIEWSQKFLNHMTGNGGGTIINIASILGFRVVPFFPIYQATKSAILAFSNALGHKDNFSKSKVRILAICPGFTETNLTAVIKEESAAFADVVAYANKAGWQKADAVGRGAVEAFKIGDTGTAWVIENSQPIVQVFCEYN